MSEEPQPRDMKVCTPCWWDNCAYCSKIVYHEKTDIPIMCPCPDPLHEKKTP